MRLVTVSAGLRNPSSTRMLADRLGTATVAALQQAGHPTEVEVVEVRLLARAIADALVTGLVSPDLQAGFDTVAAADGVIAVTPAFNASFSGLFKAFFDVLPEQTLTDMPVLIAATGGTDRHSLVLEHAMRPMFSYLHAIVSPTGVYAATSDFGAGEAHEPRKEDQLPLATRIATAATNFTRLLTSCARPTREDPFANDLAAMTGLLGGL